ncbi:hypothetical protein BpHYR1_008717 [Brachionus plicatilis]|uniref:Uncharacterized protein n=1 Tax=Brachionus plicatilis TaxID=10195 RepID=A0A3M7SQJ6_BRAPC|nr:hypothetical protein BpHYR1_008717 [Brachionus plicatilis]
MKKIFFLSWTASFASWQKETHQHQFDEVVYLIELYTPSLILLDVFLLTYLPYRYQCHLSLLHVVDLLRNLLFSYFCSCLKYRPKQHRIKVSQNFNIYVLKFQFEVYLVQYVQKKNNE